MSQLDRRYVDGIAIFTVCEPLENDIFDDLPGILESEESERVILDLSLRPTNYFGDADFGNLMRALITIVMQRKSFRIVARRTPRLAELDGPNFASLLPSTYETIEDAIRSF